MVNPHIARGPETRSALLAGMLAVLGIACAAGAQSIPFLTPESFRPKVGEPLAVYYEVRPAAREVAAPLVRTPWPGSLTWFFVRVDGTQSNQDAVQPAGDNGQIVQVPIGLPGVTMVGVDFAPMSAGVDAKALRAFVSGRTGASLSAVDRAVESGRSVRVRHTASAKTLVTAIVPAGLVVDASTAVSKSGQVVEIRPLFDPTTALVGGDIAARLYVNGDAVAGAKAVSVCVATGRVQEWTCNDKGIGSFRVDSSGEWRIEFHHAAEGKGEIELYTATLTFQVPVAGREGAR